jgi:hypothetical protein
MIQNTTMENAECKELINFIFQSIAECRTSKNVDAILEQCGDRIPISHRVDVKQFPRITFDVSKEDIRGMQNGGILTQECVLAPDWLDHVHDPVARLLYSMAWKNGDLPKIKHIIQGVLAEDDDAPSQAFVFHQFGRHLADKAQPIVDQHVLRAFGIHQSTDEETWTLLRKMKTIKKVNAQLIADYRQWLQSNALQASLRATPGYAWHVDQVLFALGKTVKL